MNGRSSLPGRDGVEIRHTMCDICTPGPQCGIDAYVRDGVVVKVEGTKGFPPANGKLCARGLASRQYIYREDRLQRPMARTGGRLLPVSWDEAFGLAAEALDRIRAQYGPEAVAWICGYPKWFRAWLKRLCYSFGSENYVTESSTCHQAEVMSYTALFGRLFSPDLRETKAAILWGSNGFMNSFPAGRGVQALHERGGKIVVIDPRLTHASQKVADLYLRPRLGTDAALAHAMAKVCIEEDRVDHAFIEEYVHGFAPYADYVKAFDLDTAERITGVPGQDIRQAVDLFLSEDPSTIVPGNGLTHHTNGFQTHRAILSLLAITGRVDRPGTTLPRHESFAHSYGGFEGMEKAFFDAVRPAACKPAIGHGRFPLWADMVDEAQGMDLVHQIEDGKPYPLRAAACFGVNDRMYPESKRFLAAMDKLDFVLATDIFHTELCEHADLVLPACSSFERSEVKCYADRFVNWTRPAIEPLYESRDDVAIITALSKRLCPEDTLLCGGYEACAEYLMQNAGIEDWTAVMDAPLPTPAPAARPYAPGSYLEHIETPTGKIELYSEAVAKYRDIGLHPLPVFEEAPDASDPADFPMQLLSGARIPNAIHSRLHDVPWLRSLRPYPAAEINPADAARLGLADGEDMDIVTRIGRITVKAHVSHQAAPGEISLYHGYREANVNGIIPIDHLDPYTGFPGYKQLRCRVEKTGVSL